jgi:hypothetical protein
MQRGIIEIVGMLVYIAVLYGIIRFFAPPFDSPSRLWFLWGMISAIALLTLALASYSGTGRSLWARATFAITFGFVVVLISIPTSGPTTSNDLAASCVFGGFGLFIYFYCFQGQRFSDSFFWALTAAMIAYPTFALVAAYFS